MTSVGERIRHMRRLRKMKQKTLVQLSGIDQGTLANLERGHRANPTMTTLTSLAKALGCTTDYLSGMHEDDETEDEPTMSARC